MTGLEFIARTILLLLWAWNLRIAYLGHGMTRVVRVNFWDDVFALLVLNILLAATGWWSALPSCR